MSALRVVSLVPSASETLVAWGVTPVAVTRFCEQPGLPTVGGTKNPDVAGIVSLAPDLVVVDREENRREDAEALTAAGLDLHVTQVRAVADVAPMLAGLRRALGLPPGDIAGGLGLPAGDAAGEVGGNASTSPPDPATGPRLRVWVPIWRRPWMSINGATYGSSVLAAAGADNVLADHPEPYPTVTLEEIAALAPDVVLAPSEPYRFGHRHRDLFAAVAPMVAVDGQDLFWWGVRTPGAISRLRGLLDGLAGPAGTPGRR